MSLWVSKQLLGIRGRRTHTYTGPAQKTHDDDLASEKATTLNHQLSLLPGNSATFSRTVRLDIVDSTSRNEQIDIHRWTLFYEGDKPSAEGHYHPNSVETVETSISLDMAAAETAELKPLRLLSLGRSMRETSIIQPSSLMTCHRWWGRSWAVKPPYPQVSDEESKFGNASKAV